MLNSLGIEPVIVSVDDETVATDMEATSARLVQGNLYCPAMSAKALAAWLTEHQPPEE